MNITLCNLAFAENTYGPLYHFPMGLLNIATIINNNDFYKLSIVDIPWLIYSGNTPDDYINYSVNEILKSNPDVVGFYTRCDILPSVILVSNLLKKKNKNLKIFLGGPGATFVAEEILKSFNFIDMIIIGEGETTITQLCEIFSSPNPTAKLKEVRGIMYTHNGNIRKTKDRELICDLNKLPLPNYKLINYYKNTSIMASLEAGRGCPYNCTFCSTSNFWRRKYRIKKPEQIAMEMKNLHSDFGVTSISLIHDNLIVSEKFIEELTTQINKTIPNIRWRCSGRVDNLNKHIIDLLVNSGCESLFLGIESGSEAIQKKINKNLDIKNINETLNYCEKKGLNTWASFIIGFPQETIEDIDDTIKLATDIRQFSTNQVVQIHVLSPEPGSALFENHKEKLTFTNSFSDHSLFVHDKTNYDYIELIRNNPSVFPSFFSFYDKNSYDFDLNTFCRCAKILLDFYPKTLKLLFSVYGISPTKLLMYFSKNCKHNKVCESKNFSTLKNKLCKNIDDFIMQEQIEIQNHHHCIIEYEKACWGLLSRPFITILPSTINLNNNTKYVVNPQIETIQLEGNPFDIIKEIIPSNISNCKTYFVLIRTQLESIKTLNINETTFSLINYLSNLSFFDINSIAMHYDICQKDAYKILETLKKYAIITEYTYGKFD